MRGDDLMIVDEGGNSSFDGVKEEAGSEGASGGSPHRIAAFWLS